MVFWPFVVIAAFNIENAISDKWLARIIADNAESTAPMISDIYYAITSPWLVYPLLFIGGILTWDLLYYLCRRLDRPGSRFEKVILHNRSNLAAIAYKKNGWIRRYVKKAGFLYDFNDYLRKFELPMLPDEFQEDEETNQIFGEYASLVGLGKYEVAVDYLRGAFPKIKVEPRKHLLLPDTEAETPPKIRHD